MFQITPAMLPKIILLSAGINTKLINDTAGHNFNPAK
jgi:hypothetical protein